MAEHNEILLSVFKRLAPTDLASELGITKQAVYQWRKIPAERARDVERITGIPREYLRPDIYGEV